MISMLTCPRCNSRKIKRISYAAWEGPLDPKLVAEWKCQACGESSHDPAERSDTSPVLDITVGFAVLATLAGALVCLL
jgi:ribosomal protein L37AE/L43A